MCEHYLPCVYLLLLFVRFTIQPSRVQNTWMGDPPRIEILQTVLNEIKKENLLDLVKVSGSTLLNGLVELEVCILY